MFSGATPRPAASVSAVIDRLGRFRNRGLNLSQKVLLREAQNRRTINCTG